MTFAFKSDHPLDLHSTSLPGANFEAIRLVAGNVRDVKWRRTILRRANLTDAIACNADFTSADIREAKLIRTDLRNAILVDTDLRHANLTNANVEGADFSGADLRGAKITLEQLASATISPETRLPDGITHAAAAAAKASLHVTA